MLHRGVSQGGSTLTQQLAKNLFLTQERTLHAQTAGGRNSRSGWSASIPRTRFSSSISTGVYFGSGAYGVEAAAQRYFGKSAKNVTVAEAAMLAGLVKSPSRLAPNRNPEGAEQRAQTVLDARWRTPSSSPTRRRKASIGHPSYNVKPAGAGTVNYVADWIGEVLDDLVGQIDQNIVVETTIDPKLQSVAEAAIIDELAAKSVKFNVTQGALVAMTPDGAVRAMVGGRNYAESQYNRAVTAKRQPGSAFKPFVYLTAIEAGLTPETIRQDAPLDVKGWKPENYTHEYFGSVTLTQALAMSLNTVAVRLGLEVGPKNVVRTAHRLGISSKLDANASIALGTSEVSRDRTGRRLCAVRQWRPRRLAACRDEDPHRSEARCCMTAPADQLGQVIEPRHVAMMNTMMRETLLSGHRAQGARSPAGWPPARPAPARISATPGSSATPPISSPASGSATTTTRRPGRRPAAACRWKSGPASCKRRIRAWPVAGLPSSQRGGCHVEPVPDGVAGQRSRKPGGTGADTARAGPLRAARYRPPPARTSAPPPPNPSACAPLEARRGDWTAGWWTGAVRAVSWRTRGSSG